MAVVSLDTNPLGGMARLVVIWTPSSRVHTSSCRYVACNGSNLPHPDYVAIHQEPHTLYPSVRPPVHGQERLSPLSSYKKGLRQYTASVSASQRTSPITLTGLSRMIELQKLSLFVGSMFSPFNSLRESRRFKQSLLQYCIPYATPHNHVTMILSFTLTPSRPWRCLLLRSSSTKLSIYLLHHLFNALVHSYLQYCIQFWSPNYKKKTLFICWREYTKTLLK